jgi:CBS domain-containing protein
MKAHEIMSTACETIPASESIQVAAIIMRDADVGMLPVVNDAGDLLGTVTDRDIVVRGLAQGKGADAPVEDVMTTNIICCDADDDIGELAQTMEEKQVRRVVVVSGEKRIVGVVSLADIATRSPDRDLGGEVLEKVSQPTG